MIGRLPKNNESTIPTPTMAPDSSAYRGSYTSLAHDCHHVIHYSVPSAQSINLSDEYHPCDFVCVSANTLLCTSCENAMRAERDAAAEAYNLIWACGETDDEAAKRYNVAAIKVANFEGRMADRNVLISQGEALKAREAKWVASRRVKFDVEEGMGAGERVVKKEKKKQAIILGPP